MSGWPGFITLCLWFQIKHKLISLVPTTKSLPLCTKTKITLISFGTTVRKTWHWSCCDNKPVPKFFFCKEIGEQWFWSFRRRQPEHYKQNLIQVIILAIFKTKMPELSQIVDINKHMRFESGSWLILSHCFILYILNYFSNTSTVFLIGKFIWIVKVVMFLNC